MDLIEHLELSQEEWRIIQSCTQKISLEKEDILFYENDEENEVYYLEKGHLAVLKQEREIAQLNPGDWVGEIAAMKKGGTRTATVKAKDPCVLWKITLEDLRKTTVVDPELYIKVLSTLSNVMGDRLEQSNTSRLVMMQRQLEMAKLRNVMALFLCYTLFALSSFFYAVKIIHVVETKPSFTTAINIPLIILLSYFLVLFVKKTGYPLSDFGLTLKNWKRSIVESVLYTIPLCALLLALKWVSLATIPSLNNDSLFYYPHLLKTHPTTMQWLLATVGYALFVPLQSLLVNGGMQGTFVKLFVSPRKTFLSIVLSNLIFSTLHLQISLVMAIGVFFIGCFWGWLYSRHQTILGISISHAIVGIWFGLFLGYNWIV